MASIVCGIAHIIENSWFASTSKPIIRNQAFHTEFREGVHSSNVHPSNPGNFSGLLSEYHVLFPRPRVISRGNIFFRSFSYKGLRSPLLRSYNISKCKMVESALNK